jgi:hypothetical protein
MAGGFSRLWFTADSRVDQTLEGLSASDNVSDTCHRHELTCREVVLPRETRSLSLSDVQAAESAAGQPFASAWPPIART